MNKQDTNEAPIVVNLSIKCPECEVENKITYGFSLRKKNEPARENIYELYTCNNCGYKSELKIKPFLN